MFDKQAQATAIDEKKKVAIRFKISFIWILFYKPLI